MIFWAPAPAPAPAKTMRCFSFSLRNRIPHYPTFLHPPYPRHPYCQVDVFFSDLWPSFNRSEHFTISPLGEIISFCSFLCSGLPCAISLFPNKIPPVLRSNKFLVTSGNWLIFLLNYHLIYLNI